MFTIRRTFVPSLCLLSAAAGALLLGQSRPALSYPDEPRGAVRFEYTTTNVEVGSLQAKLAELGLDGWDVFSVERSDSVVDQTPDGKTHLFPEKFQVSAKRAAKP